MTKQQRARLLPWVLLFFWLARPVSAQTIPSVPILTEVYPAPIGSGSEWVELYNPTSQAVDLAGWTLEDQLSTPSLITTLSQTIQPFATLVISLPSAKLNNSADGVTLKNVAGAVVDAMSYSSSASDQSWSRSSLTTPATWTFGVANPGQVLFPSPPASPSITPTPSSSISPTPTPSPTPPPTPSVAASPSPAPTPTPDSGVILTISELSACPETGQSEWVEVYNPTTSNTQLQNFLVRDASGNTELLNGTIPPMGYSVFFWTKSLLNNSGDSLFLISNTGQILDSATYDDCQSDRSLTLVDGVWSPATPSPGKANSSSTTAMDTGTLSTQAVALPTSTPTPSATSDAGAAGSTHNARTSPLSPATPLSQTPWWPASAHTPLATVAAQPRGQSQPPSGDAQYLHSAPPVLNLATATAAQTHRNPYNGIIGGLLLMLSSGSILAPTFKQVISHVQATAPAAYSSFSPGPPLP